MMGGYGASGYGSRLGALNLSAEQRAKLDDIWQYGAKQRWNLMGDLHQEQYKLNGLLASDADQAMIDAAYQAVSNTRKQMIDSMVSTAQAGRPGAHAGAEEAARGWTRDRAG